MSGIKALVGGWQRQPFLLHLAEPVIGAGHLHQVLKGWVRSTQAQMKAGVEAPVVENRRS
ncbi:MAG TPA: hypothetical protein VLE70_13770 [Anaerolineae bacterium]|jgi:hypothetical protein|nr:hypothetical protein [Anaerolineae bacterium]